ncbi:hypothetical protein BDFB_010874 [Asbolus verrucosus]|uniref:Uncharacterized protein n=1 Tax=Asbolus verrucosus TaxID=1661398 RepID=A0A482VKN0_ASBVE|nr:hypothetical protein BDFB_010874 [Asbolus verrucosus]
MNSLSAVVFLVALAAASASGILGGHGAITGVGAPAVIAGPAGSIVRAGVAPAPAIVAGHAGLGLGGLGIGGLGGLGLGGIVGAGGIVAGHGGLLGHGLVGSGLEGQWIPDINEKLYDDGSYKPHIYGH